MYYCFLMSQLCLQMTLFVSGSTCPYTYDVIEDLQGKNVTSEDAEAWPCELRTYWVEILPLVKIVRWLLSYGTSTIIIFGVILNTLSFIVLTRKYMRKTTSNLYLAFLAVYDTCSLIFNFMIGVIRGNNESVNKNFQVSTYMHVVKFGPARDIWLLSHF